MSDVATTPAAPAASPFKDQDWSDSPSNPEPPVNTNTQSEPPASPASPAPAAPAAPASQAKDADVFDADAYLKEQLGLESWEAAKAAVVELNDLREKAKTPAQFKYANEQSEKIAKAINEGDEEAVWSYFDKKRKLTTAKSLDISDPANAANLVKLNWQLENKDLSTDDVDYMFRKRFSTPRKPVQSVDQSDVEYQEVVDEWQSRVNDIQRELSIEAKMAKPKLAQHESSLVLPDTKKEVAPAAPAPPTPEELAAAEQGRQRFLSDADNGVKALKEFKTMVKDEEVELPVSYLISDEEKARTKVIAESMFTNFDYFINRWKDEGGVMNLAKMAEDIALLENREKIFQKIANESAAKRLAHKVTSSKHPVVNTPTSSNGNGVMNAGDGAQQMADFWKNS